MPKSLAFTIKSKKAQPLKGTIPQFRLCDANQILHDGITTTGIVYTSGMMVQCDHQSHHMHTGITIPYSTIEAV